MKMSRLFITCVYLLAVMAGNTTGQSPPTTPLPTAENVALLKGFIVTGTLTKVTGTFSSYGIPSIGDAFEINLSNLPKEKIEFTGQASDSLIPETSYIPFAGALIINRVRQGYPAPNCTTINLIAVDGSQNFFIKVIAEKLEKGGKVHVTFYQVHASTSSGPSLAEAEGVLK